MENFTKTVEVYERDEKNSAKTYNLKFIKEYDVSKISINELKNIITPNEEDENIFLMYTLEISQIYDIQKKANVFFDIDNEKFIYMFTQCSS